MAVIKKIDGVWVLAIGSKILLRQKANETFVAFEERASKHGKKEKK